MNDDDFEVLNEEEILQVAGGDSWAGTPEGRAPVGDGLALAQMVDDCTTGNLLVCSIGLFKALGKASEQNR